MAVTSHTWPPSSAPPLPRSRMGPSDLSVRGLPAWPPASEPRQPKGLQRCTVAHTPVLLRLSSGPKLERGGSCGSARRQSSLLLSPPCLGASPCLESGEEGLSVLLLQTGGPESQTACRRPRSEDAAGVVGLRDPSVSRSQAPPSSPPVAFPSPGVGPPRASHLQGVRSQGSTGRKPFSGASGLRLLS